MSKTVKAIVALVAAVILLAAGYGTYALWSDNEVLDGGGITAGSLAFEGTTPGVWRDVSAGGAGTVIDVEDFLVVPGDVLTYTLTRTVEATGDNLEATLAADPASVTGDPELRADMAITTAITVDGTTQTAVTEENDGDAVVVTVRFEFDEGSTNATQLQSLDLSALQLTLQQNPR